MQRGLQVGGLPCRGGQARGPGDTDPTSVQMRQCPSSFRGTRPCPGPCSDPSTRPIGEATAVHCCDSLGCVRCMHRAGYVCVCVCDVFLMGLNLLCSL